MKILDILTEDIEGINEKLAGLADLPVLEDFLTAPAKRIRPTLALLYLRAKGETVDERIYSFLSAIELIHNASLIHDDIIDESAERRGEPALHTTLDSKLAVISGDYLLSKAMIEVSKLNSVELIALLSETMQKMCLGEFRQQYNRFKALSVDEYLLKSEQKTASLFEAAVVGSVTLNSFQGRITGNNDAMLKQVQHDGNFAKNFGIAFQIKNDLDSVQDIENGIYNAASTELLEIYVDRALDCLTCLEENKYKSALIEITERLKSGRTD